MRGHNHPPLRSSAPDKPSDAEVLWGIPAKHDPHWQAMLANVAALVLYLFLPDRVAISPHVLVPSLEGALLLALLFGDPVRLTRESRDVRLLQIALTCLIVAANAAALVELAHYLLDTKTANGRGLLLAAVLVWLTNVLGFSLWFWELDRGGPHARIAPEHRSPDFLFPQMASPGIAERTWAPGFVDYLYVSFTNATAFSPTDVMPLSVAAKMLMLVQSLVSFVTVALVAARAVNILA